MKKPPTSGSIDFDLVIVCDESAKFRDHAARFRAAIAREEAQATERTKNPGWRLAKRKMLEWADALEHQADAETIDVATRWLN